MCENFRYGVSANGAAKRFESVDGNAIVNNQYLPTGTNMTVGGLEDDGQQVIFNLNYNSTGNGIYAFLQGVWYIVLLDSQVSGGLGFDPHHNANGIALIGNLLFWTDNLNQPRRINYIAGIKMNHSGFSTTVAPYIAPLLQENITIIRRPPNYPLTVQKVSNGQTFSQIKNNAFYFFYSYVYRDFEISKWSERSVLMPYNAKTDTFDTARLNVPFTEQIPTDAIKVQLGAIYADGGAGFIIRTFDKGSTADLAAIAQHNAGTTQLTYDFYGTSIGAAIDSSDMSAYNDSVPNLSQGLGIAENRLFLGNNTIGYDTPPISSLSLSLVLGVGVAGQYVFKSTTQYVGSICFYDRYNRQTGAVRTSATAFTSGTDYNNTVQKTLSIAWAMSNANAAAEIPTSATSYSVLLTDNLRTSFFVQSRAATITYTKLDSAQNYIIDGSITSYTPECYGIAIQATYLYSYGIGYSYQPGDICYIYLPTSPVPLALAVKDVVGNWIITDAANAGILDASTKILFEIWSPIKTDNTNNYYERGQRFAINNAGSVNRTYSVLAGTLNGDTYLIARKAQNRIYFSVPPDDSSDDGLTRLGMTMTGEDYTDAGYTLQSQTSHGYPSWGGGNDQPFFKNNSVSLLTQDSITVTLVGSITVVPDATAKFWLLANVNRTVGPSSATQIQTYLVPTTTTTGNTQTVYNFNMDITVPSGCDLQLYRVMDDNGNTLTFHVKQTYITVTVPPVSSGATYAVEAMSANDTYWKNWFTDAGREQIVTPLGSSIKKTGLRFSDTIVLGSQDNGLSSFDALNEKDLPLSLVSIQVLGITSKAEEEGNVMLAVGEKDTVSIYLGEQKITSNSGATAFLAADGSVVGTVNELRGGYGTQCPESFVTFRGNAYWIDNINCTPIQYSANGLYAMADALTGIFWKQFFNSYNTLTLAAIEGFGNRPYLYGGIAPYYSEYVISLPKLLATPPSGYLSDYGSSRPYPYVQYDGLGKTMVYNTKSNPNSWKRADTYVSEGFVQLGNTLYAFKSGQLYRHDSGNASFFGNQQLCRLALVFNDNFSVIKEFSGIALEGCNVPATFTHLRTEVPNVQSSDLLSTDYIPKEGMFYADFLLDRLSPSATDYDNGQFHGDKMVGQYGLVLLEFDATQSPTLTAVDIYFEPSLGHTT